MGCRERCKEGVPVPGMTGLRQPVALQGRRALMGFDQESFAAAIALHRHGPLSLPARLIEAVGLQPLPDCKQDSCTLEHPQRKQDAPPRHAFPMLAVCRIDTVRSPGL